MTSQVDIYNMSLGNIGQSETVASINERSKPVIVCNQYWQLALDTLIAAFPWPFATRFEKLALLPGSTNAYQFRYQYPTDCLRALYLTTPSVAQPDELLQPRWEVAYGTGGQMILSNESAAELAYVQRIDDVGRLPPLAVEALSWKLAALIAMPMTNTRTIAETASALYQGALQQAWSQALNESKFENTHESEFIVARGA